MSNVLLLGCGNSHVRRVRVHDRNTFEGQEVHGVDIMPVAPKGLAMGRYTRWDLNQTPWPYVDGYFDEVHAYEVLEHLGSQGDYMSFFAHFYEVWRILKVGGILAMSVPRHDSVWAWGDPGHTRVISLGSLAFLDQDAYAAQVGNTAMADYREVWRGDLKLTWNSYSEHNLYATLMKVPVDHGSPN